MVSVYASEGTHSSSVALADALFFQPMSPPVMMTMQMNK
jgi:hypothetical protein